MYVRAADQDQRYRIYFASVDRNDRDQCLYINVSNYGSMDEATGGYYLDVIHALSYSILCVIKKKKERSYIL
ncbi:hypothetical protein [Bacillus toyonensis]|uniref:hypothetical protein n=1 Tax=Bacillus toyonensis TaxID=155322 RepID=UPI0011557E2E|nr:hypothetical protein [Bacillus toyonensis]